MGNNNDNTNNDKNNNNNTNDIDNNMILIIIMYNSNNIIIIIPTLTCNSRYFTQKLSSSSFVCVPFSFDNCFWDGQFVCPSDQTPTTPISLS